MSIPHEFVRRLAVDSGAVLPLGLWAGLSLIDLVIWSRRFAGAMTVLLPAPLAIGSSLMIAAVAIFAPICWRQTERDWFPRAPWWPELLTLALGLLWGWAAGVGTSPFSLGALAALWGMMVVTVGLVSVWFPENESVKNSCELVSVPAKSLEQVATNQGQQATHTQKRIAVEGGEMVEGEAQVEFPAGQKEAIVHLSFCPPFAAVPDVQGEDASGGDLEVKAQAVQTFGARLAVRRTAGIDRAETRQISYVAFPPGSSDAAA